MKSRKRVWIATLCLLSAAVITFSIRGRLTSVHAAAAPVQVSRAITARAMPRISNATLRAAALQSALMLDEDVGAQPVNGDLQSKQTIFPQVEKLTLTPPNIAMGNNKTTLAVRFRESQAAKLSSRIPMKIGSQDVVLLRSSGDPSTFVASLDFNWQKFAEEQAQRKAAAAQGRIVSIFDGRRFVRREKMEFLEPEQIREAMESHQPIQFSPDQLAGSTLDVFPDHELMMTSTDVVQDLSYTFDQCIQGTQQGMQNGPWTFSALMMAIANTTSTQVAENMLLAMLNSWNQNQIINVDGTKSFTVLARTNMGALNSGDPNQPSPLGLLGNWPVDTTLPNNACTGPTGQPAACPSLANAPMRLEAIVNRMDLGGDQQFPVGGELRFVFTSSTGLFNGTSSNACAQGFPFNIILEYSIPSTFTTPLSWATKWAQLPDLNSGGTFSPNYLQDLEALTALVVGPTSCNGGSCLAQIRTNEILLAPASGPNANLWEQREFHLVVNSGQPNQIVEGTLAMTPDLSYNTAGQARCNTVNNEVCTSGPLAQYINSVTNNQEFILTQGASPAVSATLTFNGSSIPFLGGSVFQSDAHGLQGFGNGFWADTVALNSERAREFFSTNTCNGCHGAETQVDFQQVIQRPVTGASLLSNFLLGQPQCLLQTMNLGQNGSACTETVVDPNDSNLNATFGDIARRVTYFQNACGSDDCSGNTGGALLMPFISKPIGVH
jgi:hypothetical protein